jgi:hypothetical protein
LEKAVGAGVATRTEAALIGDTRLDEVSITDWADRNDTTTGAAYKARRRAELRLVAYLREEARDTDINDPVASMAMGAALMDAGTDTYRGADFVIRRDGDRERWARLRP